MAQKRMFDRKVVSSDKFLDLPNSTKALYFMAGMEADDKGFFQPRKLQRMCGFSDDDYKLLIAKGYFITFESGVMVVTDWNKNNWLDSRRITETEYVDELNMLKLINQKYEFKLENDYAKPLLSENSIVENSIDKNSIEYNTHQEAFDAFWNAYPKKRDKGRVEKWFAHYSPNQELVDKMIKVVERLKDTEQWKKDNGKFIPYPATWLNAKGWEDEFETDTEREERVDKEILEGTYGVERC